MVPRLLNRPLNQLRSGRARNRIGKSNSNIHMPSQLSLRSPEMLLEHVTLADLVSGQLPDEVESLAAQPDAWVAR